MDFHQILLITSIFNTGLSAGVFFTFTSLIIPGLKDSDDRSSLKGFQTIDRRLQPNSPSRDWQPVFGIVVFGSAFLIIATLIFGWTSFSGTAKILMVAAAASYNLGF